MNYSEVVFYCKNGDDWHCDLLVQNLADMGFDSFEARSDGFAAYIASAQLDLQQLELLLMRQPVEFNVSYVVNELAPRNWNAEWERNFEPVLVADKCYIRATFHPPEPAYPYEIVIDPKMAFGTGHHQTTALMVSYLFEAHFNGRKVLDMGCGTGILAILAAKLGATTVWAVDNDPLCIASVEENKLLNNAAYIKSLRGSIASLANERFDVILANINRNILVEHLPAYAEVLTSGGSLYMSGFYAGDDLEIIRYSSSQHGLSYKGHKERDGWVATKFIKQR